MVKNLICDPLLFSTIYVLDFIVLCIYKTSLLSLFFCSFINNKSLLLLVALPVGGTLSPC